MSRTSKLVTACRDCGSQPAPKSWKFQAAPCIALETFRECLALASPHGCASRTPTTHTPAFPSQVNSALLGWRRAFHSRPFSRWRGHASCKLWLAADACAEDEMVGIGGWAITSSQVVWLPRPGTCKTLEPCGLALSSQRSGGLDKLFTTSWPLQLFVQLIAFWAHAHVLLQPTHVPGRCNDWADDLSRGRLARFSHRSDACALASGAFGSVAEPTQPRPTWPSEPFLPLPCQPEQLAMSASRLHKPL